MANRGYDEMKFDDVEFMTKDQAISEIIRYFKGNKEFIEQATIIIRSTLGFQKVDSMSYWKDTWDWEKLLRITINTELGFTMLHYRKGNKKYDNKTQSIDGYNLAVYHSSTQVMEEFQF